MLLVAYRAGRVVAPPDPDRHVLLHLIQQVEHAADLRLPYPSQNAGSLIPP